ncbi:unnamed protein product [Ectocarpus sp. 12 AP-2014]
MENSSQSPKPMPTPSLTHVRAAACVDNTKGSAFKKHTTCTLRHKTHPGGGATEMLLEQYISPSHRPRAPFVPLGMGHVVCYVRTARRIPEQGGTVGASAKQFTHEEQTNYLWVFVRMIRQLSRLYRKRCGHPCFRLKACVLRNPNSSEPKKEQCNKLSGAPSVAGPDDTYKLSACKSRPP